MALRASGNVVISANQRHMFSIQSNHVFGFEIGADGKTKYFLKGEVVGPEEEFIFNGVLFLPGADLGGTILDNFPKADAPKGWEKKHSINPEGWDLVDQKTGQTLFGFRIVGDYCHVTTNIYDETGEAIATCDENGLTIHRGPAKVPPWFNIG